MVAERALPPNDALREEFERALAPHRRAIFGHALRIAKDRDHAEDVMQAAMVRCFRAYGRFDGENFRAWAMRTVTRVFINERKRLLRHPETSGHDDDLFESVPEAFALPAFERDELDAEILEALSEIPPAYARSVLLRSVGDMSVPEVAEAEGAPAGTVQSRAYRGHAYLRERLQDFAVSHGYRT